MVRHPTTQPIRRHNARMVVAIGVAVYLTAASAHAGATFIGLGDLGGLSDTWSIAHAVSTDGSTVVGQALMQRGVTAFRWTVATGMQPVSVPSNGITPGSATAVSGDGSVIAGRSSSPLSFYWTEAGGLSAIPLASGSIFSPTPRSISGDGRTVVGSTPIVPGSQAFRWTPGGETELLGTFLGGGTTRGTDVSGDGTLIVGSGTSSDEAGVFQEAFRWTESTGFVGLGQLEADGRSTRAEAVSSDGSLIIGDGDIGGVEQAFLWSAEDGMRLLGEFTAQGLADDGSVVVGTSDVDLATSRAVIWDEVHGARDLKMVLELDFGLDLDGWILNDAADVSADGTVIVGFGISPNGQSEGYVAIVPEPTSLAMLALGAALCAARRKRQGRRVGYRRS